MNLDELEQLKVSAALRKCIAQHKRVPRWSLPQKDVAELSRLLKSVESDDPVLSSLWLFESWPDIGAKKGLSVDEKRTVINRLRRKRIRQIARSKGWAGLKLLARKAAESYSIGFLASELPLEGRDKLISELFGSKDAKLVLFAQGLARSVFEKQGWPWARQLIHKEWKPSQVSVFGHALPFAPDTWDLMSRHSVKAKALYWTESRGYNSQLKLEGYERAVREWNRVKKPSAALSLLALIRENHKPNPALVLETLELLLNSDELSLREEQAHAGSRVSELIEYLQQVGGPDRRRLMVLEWNFLNWLIHTQTEPKTLLETLDKEPAFFVDILSLLYTARPVRKKTAPSEQDRLRAEKAERLLDEWYRVPGTLPDGLVDQNALCRWIATATAEAAKRKIEEHAAFKIGEVLSMCPEDSNGVWPCEPVRNVIEEMKSDRMERGIAQERFNRFQPNSARRAIPEKSWSELAQEYRNHAKKFSAKWLRTAALLRELAESCEHSAR